jgi:hypothetical protein
MKNPTIYHVDATEDGYPTLEQGTVHARSHHGTPDTGWISSYSWGSVVATVPVRVIPYTEHGDYVGSLVEKSNCQLMLDDALNGDGVPEDGDRPGAKPRIIHLISGHGYEAIGWPAWCPLTEDLAECMERLAEYPLLDDDHAIQLEQEQAIEDWDSYARDDTRRALLKLIREEFPAAYDAADDWLDELSYEDWWQWAYVAEDGGNPWWEMEGCGTSWDCARLAKRLLDIATGRHVMKYYNEPAGIDDLARILGTLDESEVTE